MGRLFGTDGVRGIVNQDLTIDLTSKIGYATACVLTTDDKKPVILIGTDTRISASMLTSALASGICSAGADVIILGVIPTPAIALLVQKYNADAGIVISASHNPAEYNGIKIFQNSGYKLDDLLEEEIEDIILNNKIDTSKIIGGSIGNITFSNTAKEDYINYLTSSIKSDFSNLNIAIDCANGAASNIAYEVFKRLNANVHTIHHEPNGVNINDNCGSTHLESLKKYVIDHKLMLGIAYDGDADRCLMIDENGCEIDGDQIMAIISNYLKNNNLLTNNALVGTVMSNLGLNKFCQENGITLIQTKVGDRYVLEEMLISNYIVGGEQSGHVILKDYSTTGDGILTSLMVLKVLKESNKTISEIASIMTKYPQVMQNVIVDNRSKISFHTDKEIKKIIDKYTRLLGHDGRILVRPSGTEPMIRVMVEGSNKEEIEEICTDISKTIKLRLNRK